MMKGATVLFEPLPIARLGVRRNDDEVVMGTDFSTFGYMLEEFVSLGTHKIAIPNSFPEISALSSAPPLLSQRISIIDDTFEIEAANRLLHPLMTELEIAVDDETGDLKKPTGLPQGLFSAFQQTRRDIKCMALGLNKSVQIELYPDTARTSVRKLRETIQQPDARAILASLEGFFSYYEEIKFTAVTPPAIVPPAMISLFDRLVNDPQYVEYSEAIATLSDPHLRSSALARLRTLGRAIVSSNVVANGWNYIAKVIKVWTGVPIPESNILSVLVSNRSLPTIVNLRHARQGALRMWMSSAEHDVPYNRSGSPFPTGDVDWLPPLNSVKASLPGETYQSLGTVGELLERLQAFEQSRTTTD